MGVKRNFNNRENEALKIADILVIGGGINGASIARDAAGRGLKVVMCEKDDLGQHTSSASTKLIVRTVFNIFTS